MSDAVWCGVCGVCGVWHVDLWSGEQATTQWAVPSLPTSDICEINSVRFRSFYQWCWGHMWRCGGVWCGVVHMCPTSAPTYPSGLSPLSPWQMVCSEASVSNNYEAATLSSAPLFSLRRFLGTNKRGSRWEVVRRQRRHGAGHTRLTWSYHLLLLHSQGQSISIVCQ